MNPLTIKQAAQILGRPASTLTRWVQQGRLRAVKFGNTWAIDPNDLKAFRPPVWGYYPRKNRKEKRS